MILLVVAGLEVGGQNFSGEVISVVEEKMLLISGIFEVGCLPVGGVEALHGSGVGFLLLLFSGFLGSLSFIVGLQFIRVVSQLLIKGCSDHVSSIRRPL